ncbi:MAG: type II toxin-antitoxin system VapC family toxin, partial [Treponema sp.]|nr:type II toxin-antitoxin system VapC family toxin [Treponema sp.]
FFNGNDALSDTAKRTILDISNIKYLSIASAWEVTIKLSIGKLDIDGKTKDFISDAEINGFIILPIKLSHLTALETLPMIHRDPFDRLLVATAQAEEMTLITVDENIQRYEVSQIW